LPVLEHFHFSMSDNTLRIIATDQDITIMTKLSVAGEEEGEILVPGRKLVEISNALSSIGNLSFQVNMENFEIYLHVEKGDYLLKGLDSEEYLRLPELFESEKPQIPSVTEPQEQAKPVAFFEAAAMSWLANKTAFAVSSDEFRPAMNGVLFKFRGENVHAVATDSFRLAFVRYAKEGTVYPEDVEVIIPARAIEILKKVDEDVLMSFVETKKRITHVRFDIGETIFISRIIDEKFPPYEVVIPKNNEIKLTLNQQDLLNSLKRVRILTSTISNQVRFIVDHNNLTLRGENEEVGEKGTEELSCECNVDNYQIAFNIKYLTEVVSHVESEENIKQIKFLFSEPNKPVLIFPDEDEDKLLMLIMPVRFTS
jgi:DNA polymerase III subunit beta